MNKTNKKGFTLAELLIVVAIIAVLVAIAIPVFTAQLENIPLKQIADEQIKLTKNKYNNRARLRKDVFKQ